MVRPWKRRGWMDRSRRLGPTNREIGELVRHARSSAGLSQQQLADRVGVTQSEVARWESGGRAIALRMAIPLAEALGLTVAALDPTSGGMSG